MAFEMSGDGFADPFKRRALVQGTGSHDRPEPLANLSSAHAAGALSDMAINDDKAHRLFDGIIGRLNSWSGNELKVGFAMLVESLGHVPDQPVERTA